MERIYRRFHHIDKVIGIFSEYLKTHGTTTFPEDAKRVNVELFFSKAGQDVGRVLCEIQSIFAEMKTIEVKNSNFQSQQNSIGGLSSQPKIDLWVIYREYETLVDYSYQLLSVLLDEN